MTLLKDWALLSSRTRRTLPTREQSLRAAEESRARYLLTQRHGQHATQPEIQLERQACLALVQVIGWGGHGLAGPLETPMSALRQ